MTTAPPALPGTARSARFHWSHTFTRLLLGTADMRVDSTYRIAPAYSSYRRRPVSMSALDPGLRRDDENGVKCLVPPTRIIDRHCQAITFAWRSSPRVARS